MHFNTQVLNKKKKKRKTISIAYDCQKFAKRTTWSHLNRNASDSTYHKKQQKFEPKFFHEYFNRSTSGPTIPLTFIAFVLRQHSIVHRSCSPHFAFARLFIHRPPLTHERNETIVEREK